MNEWGAVRGGLNALISSTGTSSTYPYERTDMGEDGARGGSRKENIVVDTRISSCHLVIAPNTEPNDSVYIHNAG